MPFIAGQHDLFRIDYDDVVPAIEVGSEGRLVLAAQQSSHLGRQTPQHDALGVNHVPLYFDITGLG